MWTPPLMSYRRRIRGTVTASARGFVSAASRFANGAVGTYLRGPPDVALWLPPQALEARMRTLAPRSRRFNPLGIRHREENCHPRLGRCSGMTPDGSRLRLVAELH